MDAAHKGLTAVVQLLVNAKANCDMQLEVRSGTAALQFAVPCVECCFQIRGFRVAQHLSDFLHYADRGPPCAMQCRTAGRR
jgi:hypothetical protein